MGDPLEELNEFIQSFYRTPDAARAVCAFESWLNTPEPSVIELHAFARMATVSRDVRAGIEALRPAKPRVVEGVLRGFDDPAFPRVSDGPPAPDEMDLLWVGRSRRSPEARLGCIFPRTPERSSRRFIVRCVTVQRTSPPSE